MGAKVRRCVYVCEARDRQSGLVFSFCASPAVNVTTRCVHRHYCDHKPSITVYVREHEWQEVGDFVYKHFDEISGVAFLPYDNGTYKQVRRVCFTYCVIIFESTKFESKHLSVHHGYHAKSNFFTGALSANHARAVRAALCTASGEHSMGDLCRAGGWHHAEQAVCLHR